MKRATAVAVVVVTLALITRLVPAPITHAAPAATIDQLQAEIKSLQANLPDQAAVMTHVGYHFSNLFFAIDKQNWPLADFYLSEARNNIKWAVRVKPMRKDSENRDVDLNAIFQAVDTGPFAALKQTLDAKDKDRAYKAYDQALAACYSCHEASSKPYLRPHRPTTPEVPIIEFDPSAR